MSNPLPLILAAGLLGGGAGAIATSAITSKSNTVPADTQSVKSDSSALLSAIASLEGSNQDLLQRMNDLEAMTEMASVSSALPEQRVAVSTGEADIEEAVRSVLATMEPDAATTVSPKLASAVEAVIDLREERAREERKQERAEMQEKRLEDRLAKLQTELGLDQNQMNSMRTIYQDQDLKREGAREQMTALRENGGSREDMRAIFTTMRDETNAAIESVLTPSQYETFKESDTGNDRGGFGRGGGGRGNGGGGGRGN